MAEDAIAQLNRIIRERRSTKPRRFNGGAVDDQVVWQLLENASWAPTHGMTQPWRFFVFTGEGLRRLARFQAALYKQSTPEAEFSPDKYERMKTNLLKSSHVIVLAMARKLEKIPEVEEIEAVACSVQNMMLTASAYGICSFWGSGGVTYTDELKEFLGLGPGDRCLGYLYLGYSDDPPAVGKRSPIQEKVAWIDHDTEA
ncbi:MAG: nitroreductase [Elainellaceae cyanobacterium]